MQLKIQRSQRSTITNAVVFCLDIRADYSAEEQHNIQKYRLGSQNIYNSRAAQKHLEAAQAQFGGKASTTGEIWGGLAKGMVSMALAKMQLNVTIASLAKGHHIECKDLEELLEVEDTLRKACKDITRTLQVAATFDGSEVVISYQNGEEVEHITDSAPPLLPTATFQPDTATQFPPQISYSEPMPAVSASVAAPEPPRANLVELWNDKTFRTVMFISVGIFLVILLVVALA
jgi:hypothetical protein